jgi:serine protease Do
VIGVNTAIISPSGGSIGIGFSVPSAIVSKVVKQIQEFGATRRGWLGVQIQAVTDELADGLGLDKAAGALVSGVVEDGPAAKGGLEVGDVIVTFDGKAVEEMRDLPRMVAEAEVGGAVRVVVWRKGESRTLKVELGLLEEEIPAVNASLTQEEPVQATTALGLTLSLITPSGREAFGIAADVTGVLVTEIDEAGPAASKGVKVGDVIVEVAQEAVSTPEEVAAKVKAAEDNGRKTVLLLVHSQGELRFIAAALSN